MIANIETFEGDISQEVENKQSSITTKIAANEARVIEEPQKEETKNSTLPIVIFILSFCIFIGSVVYYLYTQRKNVIPLQNPIIQNKGNNQGGQATLLEAEIKKTMEAKAITLSEKVPTLSITLSRFFDTTLLRDDGNYIIYLNDYSSVYGYILQNEQSFGKELLGLFSTNNTHDIGYFSFVDVTQNNFDMRVMKGTKGDGPAYGFIGTSTLLISKDIMSLLHTREIMKK